MNYLKIAKNIVEVRSQNGSIIKCSYLEHVRFSRGCNFCEGLHYVFIKFAKERTYSKVYEIRKAIHYLLDFTEEYEKRMPKQLHLKNIFNITAEFFYEFDHFCKKNKAPNNIATRLKSALVKVAEENDDGMPLLSLPQLFRSEGKPNEPLNDECFNQLAEALKLHIDKIYEKLEFRKDVEESKVYDLIEIKTHIEQLHLWRPDNKRSLNTLITLGYPFDVPFNKFLKKIKRARTNQQIKDAVEMIFTRHNNYKLIFKHKENQLISLGDLLALYYPIDIDQASIVLFIMLQSGWNKEAVLAIDKDNFEHILAGAINSNQTLIYSEKNKSQGKGKPYLSPKTFLVSSVKDDKYSIYNLILLAKKLSEPLFNKSIDCQSEWVMKGYNELFMCMRKFTTLSNVSSKCGTRPGRYFSVSCKSAWEGGLKLFFDVYPIFENGKRFVSAKDISGRLRPTWIRNSREKKDKPLSLVSLQQHHSKTETTDVYYDNSSIAKNSRLERLRFELEDLSKLFQKNVFKGMLGLRSKNGFNVNSLRVFNIPGHEKALWGCSNPYDSDWIGSEKDRKKRCSEIPKCLFCSRVYIFEDSLPFLMHRLQVLEIVRDENLYSTFADEVSVIESILDEWGDESALKLAAKYHRYNQASMPNDFSGLKVFFED